jgi:hypothetical protein
VGVSHVCGKVCDLLACSCVMWTALLRRKDSTYCVGPLSGTEITVVTLTRFVCVTTSSALLGVVTAAVLLGEPPPLSFGQGAGDKHGIAQFHVRTLIESAFQQFDEVGVMGLGRVRQFGALHDEGIPVVRLEQRLGLVI